MTEKSFVSVNGVRATGLRLSAGQVGPWVVEAELEDDTPMDGRVTVLIGEHQLSGTISPNSGTFGLKRWVRIIGGANGWGRSLPAKTGKRNDAGVKALNIAAEVAQECGETLGTFEPRLDRGWGRARLGVHYLRKAGLANQMLADVIGSALWWVDYAGVTHVGARPPVAAKSADYEVLDYNPRARVVTLAVDDPLAIGIGSVLSERLDAPQTVREFELTITKDSMRVKAWCGGDERSAGMLASVIERIVAQVVSRWIVGTYRYRVLEVVGERAHLEVVNKAIGLPDLTYISISPGLPGAQIRPAKGSEVLVSFADCDRAQPIIVGFAGKDGVGFMPDRVDFWFGTTNPDNSRTVFPPINEVARNGDPVECIVPPVAQFTGTIATVPPTPVANLPVLMAPITLKGKIVGGSSKMKIGG